MPRSSDRWSAVCVIHRRLDDCHQPISSASPGRFWLIVILLVAAVAGAGYTLTRPSPLQVVASVTPPDPPADVDDPRPGELVIRFDYDRQDPHPNRQIPQGPPSVARIDLIGKPVTGIQLEPALAGRWQWRDDHTLTFEPEPAWPAGTPFRIVLPPAIFSPETRLKKKTAEFTTPAFTAAIESIEFYQDPAQSSVRKVVATLYFSHPVDPAGLEQHLSMAMRPSGEGMDTPPQPVSLSVTYDKRQRRAYVSSAPLDLPAQANTLRLTIAAGVAPATGGKATTQPLSDTVVVPDRYSFLKVSAAKASIVTNDRQEPQQVISLDFTDAIDRQTLLAKLSVYLLPAVNPRRNSRRWNGPREVTPQDLAVAQRLALKIVPNPRDAATHYHFVIDAPERRYLYLRIDPHLASVNGFVQASFFDAVLAVPAIHAKSAWPVRDRCSRLRVSSAWASWPGA
ncbi:hypothetical protein [Desulfosarcina cetonica]|uniref:hypothetical protein n=1 Tax=Desulfosarcina cetonica TaxID=90730 RepID=UPI0006D0FC63|nr:hypothetical protein [Desulfosarcina cetonica]